MQNNRRFTSLSNRGSRIQFDIAIALMVVIPLLTAAVLVVHISQVILIPAHYYTMCLFGFVFTPAIGFSMVSRYPQLIIRLRKYLEDVAKGVLPEKVSLIARESDVAAIEDALNLVLETLRERLQRAETQKKDLEDELQETRTLEALGTLSSGVAHEINTPLQFIRINLDYLGEIIQKTLQTTSECDKVTDKSSPLTGTNKSDIEAAIKDSHDGIDRIASIVTALREFSSSGDSSQMHPLNLNSAIKSAIELSRNEWKTVAEVDLQLAEMLPEIMCYGAEIKQSLVNIVLNASQSISGSLDKTGSQKGTISIKSEFSQDDITVHISDTGLGISPEIRPHIFSPFFSTRTSEGARGNGLAYAFSTISNRHGGRLTCHPNKPNGVTFQIQLPREQKDFSNTDNGKTTGKTS